MEGVKDISQDGKTPGAAEDVSNARDMITA
jgi:hypothetical protein